MGMKLSRKKFQSSFLSPCSGWNAVFQEVEWCRGKAVGLGLGDNIRVKAGGDRKK